MGPEIRDVSEDIFTNPQYIHNKREENSVKVFTIVAWTIAIRICNNKVSVGETDQNKMKTHETQWFLHEIFYPTVYTIS